ncbi:MAG TPA: hypothetical protein VG368_01635, partial [Acidimicrobiales bacterium]|nr:hypothetical protein [Acidimicrobiales bacterium]
MALTDGALRGGIVDSPPPDGALEERIALEQQLARERRSTLEQQARRRRERARRRRRQQIRRNRTVVALGVVAAAAVAWSVVPGGHSSADAAKSPKLAAQFTPVGHRSFVVPGALAALPWPSKGEGAIAVAGAGVMATSGNEKIVPIASLTKMMTAYVVLRDHPLALGGEGPSFTMTQADVDAWVRASQAGYSNIAVAKGEVLTEHQLLEALLIPSADNVADFLAAWDGGSQATFVKKMNAMARTLGLTSTHYADASGVNRASQSNARDQARLTAVLMADPVVRSIVSHRTLPFQVMGTIRNFNPALGVDGIIGVKSGFTSAAGGCLASAAYETVHGHSVLVVAVSLGQIDGLDGAARADEHLVVAGAKQLVATRAARSGTTVGSVS